MRQGGKNMLHTSFLGLDFKNPLMPASGPLVGDSEKMILLSGMGLGGMVSKTISTKPAVVPRPCIIAGKNHIMNAELWSEHSMEAWVDTFLPQVKERVETPLLISVGYTKEDMEVLIPKLEPFADAFEVSTHYVGKDLSVIEETVRTIRSLTEKPFFMKVSPHMPDPVAFCKRVLAAGGNGVVAINSLGPTMTVDLKTRSVVMGNQTGEAWMSGPAIKPIALALIAKIKREVPECVVIGVGGIATAKDVLEFLLVGASAVQMLSAAMMEGIGLYKKILDDLPKVLKEYGFNSVQEVIDTPLVLQEMVYEPTLPVVDMGNCVLCNKCVKACPYLASEERNKSIVFNEKLCFGCRLCESLCPKGAIS
jgi:dihydroorotate dehydrogenase (fumarate)